MKTTTPFPLTELARGPVNTHMDVIAVDDLLPAHLDYSLACLMPFNLVHLEHMAGLVPVWVVVETENEKRRWNPSSKDDQAKEVFDQLDPSSQLNGRAGLLEVLKKHIGPTVNVPILTSQDVPSPYSSKNELRLSP